MTRKLYVVRFMTKGVAELSQKSRRWSKGAPVRADSLSLQRNVLTGFVSLSFTIAVQFHRYTHL